MLFWDMIKIDSSGISKSKLRELEHNTGLELCKRMLLEHFGIENPKILIGEHGKPYLDGNEAYFNISHSHGAVVCVVSSSRVGIDIEAIPFCDNSERLKRLAKRFFGENEIDFVFASDNICHDFYYIWTRKEALSKCVGLPFLQMRHYDALECESITSYENDGYIISIATNI